MTEYGGVSARWLYPSPKRQPYYDASATQFTHFIRYYVQTGRDVGRSTVECRQQQEDSKIRRNEQIVDEKVGFTQIGVHDSAAAFTLASDS